MTDRPARIGEALPEACAEALRAEVRARYGEVAVRAEGQFPYPVGRASAERLGYDRAWLEAVPTAVVARFVGVGNPFRLGRPRPGARVLDVGCGAGLDAFVASRLAGPTGAVVGLDLTAAMLDVGRRAAVPWSPPNLRFVEGSAEALPFGDATFDLVLSNGVLNLVPDKPRAFREIRRVLRPSGILQAADLVVLSEVPPEVLAAQDAWST